MSGWTNRGKYRTIRVALGATDTPSSFRVFLITPSTAPTAGTDTLSVIGQIADGNGYSTGGYTINRDTTDWDTFTESDTGDRAFAQLKDVVWTASGGAIPSAGSGARYAVLGNYTSTLASTDVWYYWDLSSERSVSDGQTITLQNCEVRANES